MNDKKLKKINSELQRLKSVIENPGYSEKAKDSIKQKHKNQVRVFR